MTKKYGPWIGVFDGKRPEHLKDHQIIQPVVVHMNGEEVRTDLSDRSVGAHIWNLRTLAYRLQIETKTHLLFGKIGEGFTCQRYSDNTHRITYEVEGDVVVSCKMEAL